MFNNSSIVEGEWINLSANGLCAKYYPNGKTLFGLMINDKREGIWAFKGPNDKYFKKRVYKNGEQ